MKYGRIDHHSNIRFVSVVDAEGLLFYWQQRLF